MIIMLPHHPKKKIRLVGFCLCGGVFSSFIFSMVYGLSFKVLLLLQLTVLSIIVITVLLVNRIKRK